MLLFPSALGRTSWISLPFIFLEEAADPTKVLPARLYRLKDFTFSFWLVILYSM